MLKKVGRKSIAVKMDVRDAQDVQKGLDKVKAELGIASRGLNSELGDINENG